MPILTPQGQDLREHLLTLDGVDEELVQHLETETVDYARLFFRIMTRRVTLPRLQSGKNRRYMEEKKVGAVEHGELDFDAYPVMPSDIVLEEKNVAQNDAYALRQYMNCLLLACLQRIMMDGNADNLELESLVSGTDQVATTTYSTGNNPMDFMALHEELDDTEVERNYLASRGRAGEEHPSLVYDLESDLDIESRLYGSLAYRRATAHENHNLGPLHAMGRSRMHAAILDTTHSGTMSHPTATQAEFLAAIVAGELLRFDNRATILNPADAQKYIEGAMPWDAVADHYKLTEHPRAIDILQAKCRAILTETMSHIVSKPWCEKSLSELLDQVHPRDMWYLPVQ